MAYQADLDDATLDRLASKLADRLDDEIRYTTKHSDVKSGYFSIIFKVTALILLFAVPLIGFPLLVYAVARDSSWYCGNCHTDTSRFSKFCTNCGFEYA